MNAFLEVVGFFVFCSKMLGCEFGFNVTPHDHVYVWLWDTVVSLLCNIPPWLICSVFSNKQVSSYPNMDGFSYVWRLSMQGPG